MLSFSAASLAFSGVNPLTERITPVSRSAVTMAESGTYKLHMHREHWRSSLAPPDNTMPGAARTAAPSLAATSPQRRAAIHSPAALATYLRSGPCDSRWYAPSTGWKVLSSDAAVS